MFKISVDFLQNLCLFKSNKVCAQKVIQTYENVRMLGSKHISLVNEELQNGYYMTHFNLYVKINVKMSSMSDCLTSEIIDCLHA